MTNEKTDPCVCRNGDVLENPAPRCTACDGDEMRRF